MRAAGLSGMRAPARVAPEWLPLGVLVLAQIGYPLTAGRSRADLVAGTVLLGFAISVHHAIRSRGVRVGVALVVVTTLGGLAVETLGVHTGVPFGGYRYTGALGPALFGVPLIIPLAWTWLAWPAWLAGSAVAARWAGSRAAIRIGLAGLGLAGWDLFLDPQMVAAGYWRWTHPQPGLAGIPYTNYLGWWLVATLMMAVFAVAAGSPAAVDRRADAPMFALYLWTYFSSVLAHAVFLHLRVAAVTGALGMGPVALGLVVTLCLR